MIILFLILWSSKAMVFCYKFQNIMTLNYIM